ncbi:hypothetical protein, partial [Psychrobacter sp. 1Y4]|uniref:hypothetical protein n=1 Tax=Psychrobacter sp. 1Y4 TaxID=3453575 RepID=UPI003F48EDE4
MPNDTSSITKAEFYDWLRGHQENKRLDQSQVDPMEALLEKVSVTELQAALGKLNGWYVPGVGMKLSAAAVEMIKDYEKFVGHPYKDL